MKTIQNLFVFGTMCCAALIFAGCGNTADTGGSGDSGAAASGSSDDGSAAKEEGTAGGSDTSSTTVTTGDHQLVSLNVPKMT